MAKKILIVLILLIVLAGVSLYLFRGALKQYTLNLILKSFPIPNVALAGINFDETTGKLHLEDIKVKNPKGFQGKYMMEASSVDIKLSIAVKPSVRLDVNNINIQNPVFYVERSAAGRWNFQEFEKKESKKDSSASIKENSCFSLIDEAFAEDASVQPKVSLPSTINIKNGVIHYLDNFILPGHGHHIDIFPLTGIVSLTRSADEKNYEKIAFNGFANLNGKPESEIKGNFEIYPARKIPDYFWQWTCSGIPLANLKPYLDKYTPFIVTQGAFNINSDLKSAEGAIDGNYTIEISDLAFCLDPQKSGVPFLETSVQKLTMYLTNQKGNVVIDFKQKTDPKGNVRWGLGPIAKRAVGMMAIDTVVDIIQKTQGSGDTADIIKQNIPKEIPPEIIDIFKEIIR